MSTIYRSKAENRGVVDWRRFRFYAWVGLAYLPFWLIGDAIDNPETFSARFWNNLWRAAYIVAANYLFFEKVLPNLSGKHLIRSVLMLFGQFLVFSFGLYGWRALGIGLHVWTPLIRHDALLDGVCYHFPYSIISVFFFGLIKHIYDHIRLRQTAQQLRIEKQEAELNYLKSQTNPHFLFNTLNNIYALANEKSDLAPESILRLSEILRFMLYEAGGAYIAVEKEIKIIGDYIALEKLRYDDSLRVDFRSAVQDPKQPVPPLLLIPLVENAFKHGASETRLRPFVDIQLYIDDGVLRFRVENSTEQIPEQERRVQENIGLANLRRQLELLYREYELIVEQGESTFSATLNIHLASHV
jgi:hypothetical protein